MAHVGDSVSEDAYAQPIRLTFHVAALGRMPSDRTDLALQIRPANMMTPEAQRPTELFALPGSTRQHCSHATH